MAGGPSRPGDLRGFSGYTAVGGMAITPSDSDITFPRNAWNPRGISIGAEGTLHVLTFDDSELTYASGELATGVIHPISVKRVYSTGTNATGIKVYW